LAQRKSNKKKQPAEIASGDLRGRARVRARLVLLRRFVYAEIKTPDNNTQN